MTYVHGYLMSNVPGVLLGVHLSIAVYRKYIYRKYIYSRSACLTSLLHVTVHAQCTGPLELGPKFPSCNSFSLVQSHQSHQSEAIRL